ncbi:MAG: hypothetical protein IT478_04810, partial [Xanthomonadales bacterium]|nr:hypothetical protein [Xanthomonadales bacterium]
MTTIPRTLRSSPALHGWPALVALALSAGATGADTGAKPSKQDATK